MSLKRRKKKKKKKETIPSLVPFNSLSRKQTNEQKGRLAHSFPSRVSVNVKVTDQTDPSGHQHPPMLILCSARRPLPPGKGASMTSEPVPSCMHIFVKRNRYRKKKKLN